MYIYVVVKVESLKSITSRQNTCYQSYTIKKYMQVILTSESESHKYLRDVFLWCKIHEKNYYKL